MYIIEDEIHAESVGEFLTLEAAIAELRRLYQLPWDEEPNLAPCINWHTCGRAYELVEYDASSQPWQTRSRLPALNVSAANKEWLLPQAKVKANPLHSRRPIVSRLPYQ